jgi:hypothetical protein
MKYKKKSDCPPLLQKWLDRINDAPFVTSNEDERLYSWNILVANTFFELTGQRIAPFLPPSPELDYGDWKPPTYEEQQKLDEAHEKATSLLKEKTKKFPKLYSYLFEIEDCPAIENIYDKSGFDQQTRNLEKTAYQRYEKFLQMQSDITKIARKCMRYRKDERFIDFEAQWERLGFKRTDKGYRTEFTIKDGVIGFESELTQILGDVPAERLRICPICKEVFWAKRIETSICSNKKCSNDFHQRKIRIKEYENRLDEEHKKYEKMQSSLSSDNPSIKEQRKKVNSIIEKLNREKNKNGTL